MRKSGNFKPLIGAGILVGAGGGGILEGIILSHNLMINAFNWITLFIGIFYLWNITNRIDVPHSSKAFYGSLILGWGIYNLAEGILAHHVFKIHHIIETYDNTEQLYFDLAFLLLGALQILIGRLLIKSAKKDFKIFEFSEPINERIFS